MKRDELVVKLKKFLKHEPGCSWQTNSPRSMCDCGLKETEAALEEFGAYDDKLHAKAHAFEHIKNELTHLGVDLTEPHSTPTDALTGLRRVVTEVERLKALVVTREAEVRRAEDQAREAGQEVDAQ